MPGAARSDDDHAHARRAVLVRHVPPRRLAELLPGRAVLARPGGPEPVFPRDDAQYRAVRYARWSRTRSSALFDRIGPGILVTHSQSGGPGWRTAIKSRNVRAIVAYEPGSDFMFPEGEVPAADASSAGALEAVGVPLSEFMRAHEDPDRRSTTATTSPSKPTREPGRGQLARTACDGAGCGGMP